MSGKSKQSQDTRYQSVPNHPLNGFVSSVNASSGTYSRDGLSGTASNAGRLAAQAGHNDREPVKTFQLGPYEHIQDGSLRGMTTNGPLRDRFASARGTRDKKLSAEKTASSTLSRSTASASSVLNSSSSRSKLMFDLESTPPQHHLYDFAAEPDDYLHHPDDGQRKERGTPFVCCSSRGILNVLVLVVLVAGLLALFAGYPIVSSLARKSESTLGAFGIGGTNGTGQVPVTVPQIHLKDPDTPASAMTWTSPVTRDKYHLVFSDEFEQDGRTFWPNDDPFWEAQNIWYGATGDYEWYTPEQINTTNGALQITLEAKPMHNLNFRSGMLTSWNKFCFQGGYIEFSATLPGSPQQVGWWPGLWTMGNLARPGYLGTTDGMWPYSYDSCDSGILRNQTAASRNGYDEVSTFSKYNKNGLSWLNGMRSPSCTCAGEDHPGPNNNVARSAPELDILEAQIKGASQGQASQSVQLAPFDMDYTFDTSGSTVYSRGSTTYNSYKGGVYQQSCSAVTDIPDKAYALTGNTYTTFGVDYVPDFSKSGKGAITWYVDGQASWTITEAAFPARSDIDIGQRLVPLEAMAIIINLGLSRGFQADLDFDTLTYPAVMRVDYVRVYQPDSNDKDLVSCDPPDFPTSKYIQDHVDVYNNPNLTTWPKAFPKNRLTGC